MSSKLKTFIEKRLEKEIFTGLPLTIFIIVFLILLATFVGITDAIVNSAAMIKLDNDFANFLYLGRTPFLARVFYIITNLADPVVITVPVGIFLVYLYFKKELAYLYSLLLTFAGTSASVLLIKIFINRARPGASIAYYLEGSKSFPSGHSAVALAIFGFVVYYLLHHVAWKDKKIILVFLGIVLIGLIGFSRLYLGVHYLSDVLGGYLIGGLWLVAGIVFREQHFYTTSLKKGKNP